MAQIPNYYYNSPWIADAAKSLASAFAPIDPEKDIARRRDAWMFEQLQKKAGLEEHDRSERDLAEGFFGQIASFKPILKEDGTEDTEATERAVMELYGKGIEHGGDITKGMALSGPYAPAFTAKQILQTLKAQAAANAMVEKYRLIGGLQDDRFENEGVRDARRHGYAVDIADVNYKNKLALQADAHLNRIAEKRAAAALNGGKPPRMIPRSAMEDIIYGFDLKEEEITGGRKIPKKYRDKMVEEAEDLVQKGGKVQTAVNAVWAKHKLDAVPEPKAKGFFDFSGPDAVIPEGFDEPAVDPNSLGGAAVGAGADAVAAAATPVPDNETLPQRALQALSEGVETPFNNGQVWTLVNGKPKRLK